MTLPLFISISASIVVMLVLYFLFVPRNTGTVSNDRGILGLVTDDLYQSLPKGLVGRKKKSFLDKVIRDSGNPWQVSSVEFTMLIVLSGVVGFVVGCIIGFLSYYLQVSLFVPYYLFPFIFAAGGAFLPFAKYRDKAVDRNEEFVKELPACLDILIVSVSSGQAFSSALQQCVPYMRPSVVRDAFDEMRIGLSSGKTLDNVLVEFGERVPNDSVRTFVSALREANELNTPIVDTLTARAEASRQEYHEYIKNKASVLESKMRLSLLGTMIPALLVTLTAPSLVTLMDSLSSTSAF